MVDDVARALCRAAGTSVYANPDRLNVECSCCDRLPDGTRRCVYWETFRGEAREAIRAAYKWHKKEKRWPSFAKED